jgi:small subunit ribosomal protein S8
MNSTRIDLIIRLKNGYLAEKQSIAAPYSKLNMNILDILLAHGYIKGFTVEEDRNKKTLLIDLLYRGRESAVRDVKLYSRPGRREYAKRENVRPVLGGLGMSIVSTSKGLMTDTQARDQKIGGEVLFSIW